MAFSFESLKDISLLSKSLCSFYTDYSSLYRNKEDGSYLLVLKRDKMDVIDFVKACNLSSEFGGPLKGSFLAEAFLEEHYDTIIKGNALYIMEDL